ncbi:MAG: SAM-dependent methyltransferase, partial [Ruminococcus sp.]|nr:SAM-dependent methyltransferase [Ruminococcus sp.]
YKDHLKIYQKKPIYWLFDSGKNNGFKALTYMHRYTKYTAGITRSDYLHPLQQKYDGEIERLSEAVKSSEIAAADRTEYKTRIEIMIRELAEARAYDMVIAHIALMTIKIDLDDGVTKNYAKFQNVEIPQDNRDPVRMDLFGKIL